MSANTSNEILNEEEFWNRQIYDMAIKAGTNAFGRVDRSTINNLLSVFYSESKPTKSLIILVLYVLRQTGRGEIPRYIGNMIVNDLNRIFKLFKDDEEKLRKAIAEYLTYLKWAFETRVRNANSFSDLVNKVISR